MSRESASVPAFAACSHDSILDFVKREWKAGGNRGPGLTFGLWNGAVDERSAGFQFSYARGPGRAGLPSLVSVTVARPASLEASWWTQYLAVIISAFEPQWALVSPDWIHREPLPAFPGWLAWVSDGSGVSLRACGSVTVTSGGELLTVSNRLASRREELDVVSYRKLHACVAPLVGHLQSIGGVLRPLSGR
jgi:hypothetical protein